jgi:hypothetical protein
MKDEGVEGLHICLGAAAGLIQAASFCWVGCGACWGRWRADFDSGGRSWRIHCWGFALLQQGKGS